MAEKPIEQTGQAGEKAAVVQRPINPNQLRSRLAHLFTLEDLKLLCADLDVIYENLQSVTRSGKAMDLVTYMDMRGRIYELALKVIELRPRMITLELLTRADDEREDQVPGVPPYKGLDPYTEDDSRLFFGREAEVAEVRQKLARFGLVAVTGPSASGKSSLLRAGLIAGLQKERTWQTVLCRPAEGAYIPGIGHNPFDALSARLVALLEPGLSETEQLKKMALLS